MCLSNWQTPLSLIQCEISRPGIGLYYFASSGNSPSNNSIFKYAWSVTSVIQLQTAREWLVCDGQVENGMDSQCKLPATCKSKATCEHRFEISSQRFDTQIDSDEYFPDGNLGAFRKWHARGYIHKECVLQWAVIYAMLTWDPSPIFVWCDLNNVRPHCCN